MISSSETTGHRRSCVRLVALSVLVLHPWSGESFAVDEKKSQPYFPTGPNWEEISPEAAGFDSEKLEVAVDFAMSRNTSSIVILKDGRLLSERHVRLQSPSRRYSSLLHGNADGHAIEDVASVQKSIVSFLVSIALQKKLVRTDNSVSSHLGPGWSEAPVAKEQKIKLEHLLSMTSGLNESLRYVADAGTRWQYNTNAYSQALTVICKATEMSPNELTFRWLTDPLQMNDSKWVERPSRRLQTKGANRYGFATTARDLARFGHLVLNNGVWSHQIVSTNRQYLKRMSQPSQQLNASYGYLWWLNGQDFVLRRNRKVEGPLVASAPTDMFAAQGALGRKCYVVPSLRLVVARLGDTPDSIGKKKFDATFWQMLSDASTGSNASR